MTVPSRRGQAWQGTDRQVRGAVLQVLRESETPVGHDELLGIAAAEGQLDRALASLVEDGLLEADDEGAWRLPV